MNVLTNRIGVNEWTRHARSHPWVGAVGDVNRTIEHPVCPRCEKIALRTHGWSTERTAQCPSCGWKGRATVIFNEYLERKLYR